MSLRLVCLFFFFPPLVFGASLVDAQFKLSRTRSYKRPLPRQEVEVLYRSFFAKSMSSRCRWFPSDSQYMTLMSHKCGSLRGTLMAYSRFTTEADAHRLADGWVLDQGHLRFVQFGDDCEIF